MKSLWTVSLKSPWNEERICSSLEVAEFPRHQDLEPISSWGSVVVPLTETVLKNKSLYKYL